MKIIHCADIHADSKMGTHFNREQAKQRRTEIIDTFENMVAFAKRNAVKVIIIAGDFFDTKEGYQKTIKSRIKFIISENPEIDFLYLRGNHDEDLDFIHAEPVPSNLKGFSKENWTNYRYGEVLISGREFGPQIPPVSYRELNLDPEDINIVTLHGQLVGYATKEGAPEISLVHLENKYIDYLALGHIHSYKKDKIDRRGYWAYSGCLEGRGFDETGEKGFVLLEVKDKKIKTEFIPFAKRYIHEVEVDITGANNYGEIMTIIKNKTQAIEGKHILRILLVGEIEEEVDINPEAYREALQNNFFYLRVTDRTEIKIDYTRYEKDISLKGEFIRLVKEQEDIDEGEKKKIILTGIKALAGRLEKNENSKSRSF